MLCKQRTSTRNWRGNRPSCKRLTMQGRVSLSHFQHPVSGTINVRARHIAMDPRKDLRDRFATIRVIKQSDKHAVYIDKGSGSAMVSEGKASIEIVLQKWFQPGSFFCLGNNGLPSLQYATKVSEIVAHDTMARTGSVRDTKRIGLTGSLPLLFICVMNASLQPKTKRLRLPSNLFSLSETSNRFRRTFCFVSVSCKSARYSALRCATLAQSKTAAASLSRKTN